MLYKEFTEVMNFLGLSQPNHTHKNRYMCTANTDHGLVNIWCSYGKSGTMIDLYSNSVSKRQYIAETAEDIIKVIEAACGDIFYNQMMVDSSCRSSITAAINTKNLAQNLVRVKSSNVWAYGLNIRDRKDKTGDLIVQFKNKNGGPGDVYIYYDFPSALYRKWQSAPSKGHFFWVYIRNNFNYSKLTGNKRGVLPNAINSYGGRP